MKTMPVKTLRWPAVVAGLLLTLAPGSKDADAAAVMRQKLRASERILPALIRQDFKALATNAGQLVALGKGAGWAARQTPEYALFLTEFQRTVADLAKAAAARDIDGATAAYTGLTTSCVACHKYIRGDETRK